MIRPITVNELYNYVKSQIAVKNGDKYVYISSDDEGNYFHPLYCEFTDDTEEIKSYAECGCVCDYPEVDVKDIVLLG